MHGKVAEMQGKSEERVGFDWKESFKRRFFRRMNAKSGLVAEVGDRTEQGASDGNMEILKKKLANSHETLQTGHLQKRCKRRKSAKRQRARCAEMVARSEARSWCNTIC